MTKRPTGTPTRAPKPAPERVENQPVNDESLSAEASPTIGISGRASQRAQSAEEAEQRYVAARDAWTKAMRACSSGRPADLAALAVAQEAYEEALAEQERWASGAALASIPVQPDRPSSLNGIVEQEMARRRVQELEAASQRPKGIRGFFRRRRGQ